MSQSKMFLPNDYFDTEVTFSGATGAQASVTSITISGGVATVSQTSHGYAVGQLLTFSGVTGTGVTGLNGTTWQVASVTDANTYTFLTSLTGTVGGTILAQPLYFPASGNWMCVIASNAIVEYNPDNTADAPIANSIGVTGATWRTLVATSSSGNFVTDGWAVRVRAVNTTASTYLSHVR